MLLYNNINCNILLKNIIRSKNNNTALRGDPSAVLYPLVYYCHKTNGMI